MEMHPGGIKDGCAESEVAQCHSAHWSQGRRHAAAALDYLDRPGAGHRLLQHSGRRMAAGEGKAGDDTGTMIATCGAALLPACRQKAAGKTARSTRTNT